MNGESEHSTPLIMEDLGRSLWNSMHYIGYTLPKDMTPEKKFWSRMFYESIGYVFPCDDCDSHYRDLFYNTLPFQNDTGDKLSQWTVDAHNNVNSRLGKPFYSQDDANRKYTPDYAQCPSGLSNISCAEEQTDGNIDCDLINRKLLVNAIAIVVFALILVLLLGMAFKGCTNKI